MAAQTAAWLADWLAERRATLNGCADGRLAGWLNERMADCLTG